MSLGDSLKKSLLGDKSNEIIKAGTLVTTRGTGVIAVALIAVFIVMDELDVGPWRTLSDDSKLLFVATVGFVWAIVAGADAIARGLATRNAAPAVIHLPRGLKATRTEKTDSRGWSVVAVSVPSEDDQQPLRFLIEKGGTVVWTTADSLSFESKNGE